MKRLWVYFFFFVAISFPISTIAVYGFSFDRILVADIMSCVYGLGIILGLISTLFEKKGILNILEYYTKIYLGMSYFTHLTWELGWLTIFRSYPIEHTKDNPMFFAWWMYIDGGDYRYAKNISTLVVMEIFSVINGMIGSFSLYFYCTLKTKKSRIPFLLVLLCSSVVHLYSVSLYYIGEWFDNFENVKSDFISFYVKFLLANSPWFFSPFIVFMFVYLFLVEKNEPKSKTK
eukprot:TRINITY_DN7278_c0_g1_i1.p1 TRINITY_DN7278_c0_g1~~TRINITY_DN7278_c0_g1_i1.p1  ORF type:complete len:232 (+),score=2.51 TRINITY_DN7278_c0_g1_i1:7-702(+)